MSNDSRPKAERAGTSVTRRSDEQLRDLDSRLVMLLRRLGSEIPPATAAFLEADAYTACSTTQAARALTAQCARLEQSGYLVLATQSPVATDLRHVVAVLRSVNNVRRSGHLLTHVVDSLAWIHTPSLPARLREDVRQLGAAAADMVDRAATAWEQHDPGAAADLERRDDRVDLMQQRLLDDLSTLLGATEEAVS